MMISNGVVRHLGAKNPKHSFRIGAIAVLLAMAVGLVGGGVYLASAQSSAPPANTLEIGEFDIYFNPNLGTIPANTPVQIVVTNKGAVRHNFSITDHNNPGLTNLDVHFDTDPGGTGTATINAPAGVYYFFCNEPGHEQAGMIGYLTVADNATISSSEATVTPPAGS
jgi:uncharacterized cupredoxin-like copper-binding protein